MKLSVIIVSWRVKDLLQKCLESIYSQTKNISFEVIVVDNNSGDGSVEMVRNNFKEAKLIDCKVNLGFAKANNLGLKQASGDYLLLLNPDTLILDRALEKAIKYLDNSDKIGVLGCRLLNYDKTLQASVRRFPTFTDHFKMMFKLHHFLPLKKYLAHDFDYNKIAEVNQVMGAFFIITRKAFEQIGYLDENYYIWFEEVDYCQRIKKAGFKIVYYPEAKVMHYGGASFAQVGSFKKQKIFSKSRLRYILKHQSIFTYLIILFLTPVSLFLSLLTFKHVK